MANTLLCFFYGKSVCSYYLIFCSKQVVRGKVSGTVIFEVILGMGRGLNLVGRDGREVRGGG